MTMFWINLVIGAVLILVGWLCYRNPNLINPYGGMSPERKALVDIEGLKWALAIIMTVAGGLMIFTGLLSAFRVISEETSSLVMTALCFAMLVPMFIAMRRHNGFGRDRSGELKTDKNAIGSAIRVKGCNIPKLLKLKSDKTGERSAIAAIVITGLSLAFAVVLLLFSNQTPKIEVGEEAVSISGMYGRDIPLSEIVSVALLDKMPPVAIRTNGSSTGKANKGYFKLESGEKCMLFTQNKAPYIEIRTTDNLYYINGDTEAETLEIWSKLKQQIPENQ